MSALSQLPMPASLLYCIAISAAMVYLPFMAVGFARFQLGYDQSAPRAMFDKLPSYAQRATWAHQNAFEAFTLFAPAALMAYVTGQDSVLALGLAIAHVTARTLYGLFYIFDIPLLRSLTFAVGSLCTFTLYLICCRAVIG